jgi:hypothetical protein
MEQYTTISKQILELKGNNCLNATYVYALIKKYRNFETNISTLTEESIAKFANIARQNISNIIQDFKKLNNDLFNEINTQYIAMDKRQNKYSFHATDEHYFYTLNDFYLLPLDGILEKDQTKCKGLLLRLKAICINNSNIILYNKMQIASKIGISKNTLNKYFALLLGAGQLKALDGGYFISNAFIIPDYLSKDIETFNYHCIYKHCLELGAIPPIRNQTADNYLLGHFILTDEEYNSTTASNKDAVYLPLVLENRLKHLPYIVTWGYILKALCNIELTKSEEQHFLITMT